MDSDRLAREIAAHRHGRVPRELRRRQVLAEARALFEERGYAGASMDELARRVGVSKPVIYDLAGSKEQLLHDVMQEVADELAACVASAVAAEGDPARRLHAGILAFLRFVDARRAGWAALRSSDGGLPGSELAVLRRRQADQVAALVAAVAGSTDAAPDPVAAQAVAQAISGAVEFVALWWQEQPDVRAEALADLLADAFSPGLLALSTRRIAGTPSR